MGVIKGSVRREMEELRRAPDSESRAFVNNLEVILRRAAGSSLQEIDRLVGELQTIRELVETEGLSLKHRSTRNVALVCNVLPMLTLCDGELALNARTMGNSTQVHWSKQLAFTITPKSGPMRSMRRCSRPIGPSQRISPRDSRSGTNGSPPERYWYAPL